MKFIYLKSIKHIDIFILIQKLYLLILINNIMKTNIFLLIPVIILLSATCEKNDDPGNPLAGNWTKTVEGRTCTLTFSADNKWQAEFIDDATTDVWGNCTISGNQITIMDEGGEFMSHDPGVYNFSVTSSSLTLSLVNDPAEGRSIIIPGIWTKM